MITIRQFKKENFMLPAFVFQLIFSCVAHWYLLFGMHLLLLIFLSNRIAKHNFKHIEHTGVSSFKRNYKEHRNLNP